ncbi:AAA family ATPase [uncultured Desulfuromusa sp.]|uniref:phosphotransacetylase family protein n=1 Tax=uncultured Desulfuromusa sp. TaxID=219183 RepID=UPI002AA8A7E7|nr:AAA family ATPase [uncultured Desulfuromusa sp.]
MCKKIFVAATGQHCGKTTTSLSLLHLARRKYSRVGFIKPFGPKRTNYLGQFVDIDVALIAHVYGMENQLPLMSPVVLDAYTTRNVLEGKIDPEDYLQQICRATEKLEKQCDFLIIEGAGHTGVGSVVGLNNAQLAQQLDAPVLIVAGGGVGNVIDALQLNLALFRETGAEVRMILPNKLIRSKRENTLKYLELAFKDTAIQVVGGFNYSPILADPTLRYLSELLQIELQGDLNQASRIVHHVQLGAASTQRIIDMLHESTLLIVPSSRVELLVMLSTLYRLPEYQPKIAGLVINGVVPISEIVQRVIDDAKIPYMRTDATTAGIYTKIQEDVAKIGAEDEEKIALVQQLAESDLDFELIDSLF